MILRTLLAFLLVVTLSLIAGTGVAALTWFATHTLVAATTACYISGILGYVAYCVVAFLGTKRAGFL